MTAPLSEHPRVAALLARDAGWVAVEHLPEVGSTNDVALERARAGAPDGLVVVADHQTHGRGRGGHPWEDAPADEASLLVSVVIGPPTRQAQLISLAGGLAIAAAVQQAGGQPQLKWPNDVLLDDRKCAGVLAEWHRLDDREVMIVGLGVDLDWRGVERLGDATNWTSVAEVTGHEPDRGGFLADLLQALTTSISQLRGDPPQLLAAYRRACATMDRDVEVDWPDGTTQRGRAVDLDADGRLVVEVDGQRSAVSAGDVRHLHRGPG